MEEVVSRVERNLPPGFLDRAEAREVNLPVPAYFFSKLPMKAMACPE